jgi:hypothetical protein
MQVELQGCRNALNWNYATKLEPGKGGSVELLLSGSKSPDE